MLRVLLIDDCPETRDALRACLSRHADVGIAGEAGLGKSARELLAQPDYDLVFLDARLRTSEAVNLITLVSPAAKIVFIADATGRMADAYEKSRVHFVARPVQAVALASVLARVRAVSRANSPAATGPYVPAKVGAVVHALRLHDIRLVVACENYTSVALASEERMLVRRTMQQWAELLPAPQFARVHRGLYLNLARVAPLPPAARRGTKVHFLDGAPPIELNRRHWPQLRRRLTLWRSTSGLVRASEEAAPARADLSIAVLPFTNLDAPPRDEGLGDNLAEELINVLAAVPQLRIAARTSSWQFKGRPAPLAEIARQLGVRFVVEGSVRTAGAHVRITARLINVTDGFRLWSDSFDDDLAGAFATQERIAQAIAFRVGVPPGRGAPPLRRVDPEALWRAREGRHFWNLRTNDALCRADVAFFQALRIDPLFGDAWAGLAQVAAIRALYRLADGAGNAGEEIERSRAEAERALELDPKLAEPKVALAFGRFLEGDLDGAARDMQRALLSGPNDSTGYQFHAWVLAAQGRLGEALEMCRAAIALDRLSFINVDRYAALLALAGEPAAALAANERAATLRPDVYVGNLSQRAALLLTVGETAKAVAAARQVRRTPPDAPFRRHADVEAIFTLRLAGLVGEAEDFGLEVLARTAGDNYLRGFIFAALGSYGSAVAELGDPPSIMLPQLYWSEMWRPVREDPVFDAILHRLGRVKEYETSQSFPPPKEIVTRKLTPAPSTVPAPSAGPAVAQFLSSSV